jgi:hypothetical protein
MDEWLGRRMDALDEEMNGYLGGCLDGLIDECF